MADKPWHRGTFRAQGRKVRAAAAADPDTVCWRCGRPALPGDPWVAGHVVDSQVDGLLLPEHRSCNSSSGGRLGARTAWEPRSAQWDRYRA